MDSVIFNRSELERLTVKQLNILLQYYKLPNPKLKSDKVNALVQFYSPMVVQSLDENVEMSVRIKRIKEANNVW